MSTKESKVPEFGLELDNAKNYNEIWKIVKKTVKKTTGGYRSGMMLFLDDLSLGLGAYYPVGTNNIVLNRRLLNIAKTTIKSKKKINAFTYSLLTHEYLHAIGYLKENEVRQLVYKVCLECFGENHIATELAKKNPWILFNKNLLINLPPTGTPMEIVKNFEKTGYKYIV